MVVIVCPWLRPCRRFCLRFVQQNLHKNGIEVTDRDSKQRNNSARPNQRTSIPVTATRLPSFALAAVAVVVAGLSTLIAVMQISPSAAHNLLSSYWCVSAPTAAASKSPLFSRFASVFAGCCVASLSFSLSLLSALAGACVRTYSACLRSSFCNSLCKSPVVADSAAVGMASIEGERAAERAGDRGEREGESVGEEAAVVDWLSLPSPLASLATKQFKHPTSDQQQKAETNKLTKHNTSITGYGSRRLSRRGGRAELSFER